MLLMERARQRGEEHAALFVDYEHPAAIQERATVARYCRESDAPLYISTVALQGMHDMRSGTGASIVPARNLVFLAMGANLAKSIGAKSVEFGANADDFDYPDCSARFVHAIDAATWTLGVHICAPLCHTPKATILDEARRLGLVWWSCYTPTDGAPCGQCKSCKEANR